MYSSCTEYSNVHLAMDDPRFRSQRSPRDEAPGTMSLVTPPRNGTTRLPHPSFSAQAQQQASAADSRSSLHRRFTTDSGRVPTLNSMSLTSPTRDYPQRDMAQHADFPQRGAEQDFNNNVCFSSIPHVRRKIGRLGRFDAHLQPIDRPTIGRDTLFCATLLTCWLCSRRIIRSNWCVNLIVPLKQDPPSLLAVHSGRLEATQHLFFRSGPY